MFGWLKSYMPKGIYARAALILLLPIVFLQLLVSVVFIQRHFEGVTQLMTRSVNIELEFLLDEANAAPDPAAARTAIERISGPLQIDVALPAPAAPSYDIKPFFDLTGSEVIGALRDSVEEVRRVSLEDRRRVKVWLETRNGSLFVEFNRARVSASNPHQLLVIMVVLGGLMTAISYVFLRNQMRPIRRLARAATDYGKGRITPFTPSGATEVRAAGTAFLAMRARLERQVQSRTLMLSGVSHDLRTPLTRLRLGLSLLDDPAAEDLIKDVDDMQRLLDAFLDFARSTALDQQELVVPEDLVRTFVADAQRAGQSVELGQMTANGEAISLRPMAIRRAFDNLVGNALRYGTQARVSLEVTERAVRFCVEDDGPGIPPEKYDEAVSPFVRLDPARNQDKGSGVGLGLSIVADIARTHGGVLRLGKSDALGGLKADVVLAR